MQSHTHNVLTLKPSNAGKNIPDVVLKISDKFYIRKLNIANEEDALIAANLTIDYNSKPKNSEIRHALYNENRAFYALFECDGNKPDIRSDIVYAYAWAHKTSADNLVFDYVEPYKQHEIDNFIIRNAYIDLANHLIKNSGIAKIQSGTNTKQKNIAIGIVDITLASESLHHYKGVDLEFSLNFLADKNLFISINRSGSLVFHKSAWQSELMLCDKNNKISERMRTNIRWILSNDFEGLLTRPLGCELVENYFSNQEKFKKQLKTYEATKKVFELTIATDDVDFNLLITNGAENTKGATATMLAAQFGHIELLSQLLARNNNVNTENEIYRDAMYYAITGLSNAVESKNETRIKEYENCIQCLLEAKANIHHADIEGTTPIFLATLSNVKKSHIDLLLEAKANIDDLSYPIQTPLMNAAYNYSNGIYSAEVLNHLIEKKADLNKRNIYGNTAILDPLKDLGEKSFNAIKILAQAKADLTIKNNKGETVLSVARKNKYKNIIKLLDEYTKGEYSVKQAGSSTLFWQARSTQKAEVEVKETLASPNL